MTPFYDKDGVTIFQGDALSVLRELPEESVNTCVTSPPYWGLRDYGTGTWEGGNAECEHRVGGQVQDTKAPGAITNGQRPGVDASRCRICGAIRIDHQLGLERTPEEYVGKMVDVFRQVRRVMKADGTLWLNLGDCYATGGGAVGRCPGGGEQGERFLRMGHINTQPNRMPIPGLKPKDLTGIPWRVAFALQADGWYLRQEIIWYKPNPMPESVRDRCTKCHEHIFLLAKSERYYFDSEAIAEPSVTNDDRRPYGSEGSWMLDGRPPENRPNGKPRKQRKPAGWDTGEGAHGTIHRDGRAQEIEYTDTEAMTRNKRSVWTVPTAPYPAAHFATFPPALIDPCIKAGCPEGGVVLDPFLGSGTTAQVALANNCKCWGVELNPEYIKLAIKRFKQRRLKMGAQP